MVFGDPEEPRHREAVAIVAQTEEAIAAVLRRDERVGEGDATTLARIVSAVMFLSMAASVNIALSVEEIMQDIRRQVGVLLPLLEDLHPAFVEEPVRPDQPEALARVVASTSIPIAVGERIYVRKGFLPVLQAGVTIVQPDLSHAGGITECLRIAALADDFDASVAPHCPLGPVALAACLQLDFAIPNFLVQEQGLGLHLGQAQDLDLLHDPAVLTPQDGHFQRPLGAGLGICVDEDAVRRRVAAGPLDPGSPTWSLDDGGYAEW